MEGEVRLARTGQDQRAPGVGAVGLGAMAGDEGIIVLCPVVVCVNRILFVSVIVHGCRTRDGIIRLFFPGIVLR